MQFMKHVVDIAYILCSRPQNLAKKRMGSIGRKLWNQSTLFFLSALLAAVPLPSAIHQVLSFDESDRGL